MGGFGNRDYFRYITGYTAAFISSYFLILNRTDLLIVATSIYFILACVTDTHKSKIPNLLNLSLALAGISFHTATQGWSGCAHSLTGLTLGIALLLIPYFMGGFGAGDVKALGAIGAVVGPWAILNVFIYMAFFGGAMAILHYISNRNFTEKVRQFWTSVKATALTKDTSFLPNDKKESLRFPYAAAIAFGYYYYLTSGSLI